MKKFAFTAALSLLGLISCKSVGSKDFFDLDMRESLTIQSKVNEEIKLKVTSNPTTGYDWFTNYDESNEFIEVQSSFQSISNEKEEIVGAPSYKIYKIKGLKTGKYTIKLDYKRGWETGVSPIKEKTIQINVK